MSCYSWPTHPSHARTHTLTLFNYANSLGLVSNVLPLSAVAPEYSRYRVLKTEKERMEEKPIWKDIVWAAEGN